MKKGALILGVMGFLLAGFPVFATNVNNPGKIKQEIKNKTKEEIKESMGVTNPAQLKNKLKNEIKQGLLDQIKNKIKALRFSVRINGVLKEITGNVLTVTASDGKEYTVNITDKTHLRRRFWGKAILSDLVAGHQLNVIGRWHDDTQTQIDATLIKDLSVQKRWGAFFGVVKARADDNFTVETAKRGTLTVYFDQKTKFVSRDEKTISYDDIGLGHRVRVKGVWDSKLNKITEVGQVKDFTLPIKPSVSPTPSVSVTPTSTVTPTTTVSPTESQ